MRLRRLLPFLKVSTAALARRVPEAVRSVRARYDAAQTTANNRRHWTNADSLSANAGASPQVRQVLRNRSRYEVANNSYARGIVNTLANDTVGTGPRLQMLTDDPEVNRRVERAFADWSRAVRMPEKLRAMRVAKVESGEAFAVMANNERLDSKVKLDLRLIEADQVTTPTPFGLDLDAIDGIEFDQFGNPTAYHVLRSHPGDLSRTLEFDQIPADSVLHYFRADRPGQSRGIPELTPALPLFAMLRRYTLAVLGAAETAADYAAVLHTDAPPDGGSVEFEPFDEVELERNLATVLPEGWKLGQIKAEQPTTAYAEFKGEVLNEISRCLNMPFNVAAGNSSDYNFASGRLDHQVYFKSVRVEQSCIESVVLDRILAAWFDEAVLITGLLPQGLRALDTEIPHSWFWDGFEHVDPQKEAKAEEIRLNNNTTTLADVHARQGRDWEEQLKQRGKEKKLMRELGITPEEAKPTTQESDDEPSKQAEQAA